MTKEEKIEFIHSYLIEIGFATPTNIKTYSKFTITSRDLSDEELDELISSIKTDVIYR